MKNMDLQMDITTKRKIVSILQVLNEHGRPLGSGAISQRLRDDGLDLKERMIRYYLDLTDQEGLTRNLGRHGRELTDSGRKELEVAVVIDKVGFVAARVDELAYRMSFDDLARTGSVIINVSIMQAYSPERIFDNILAAFDARLGMGRYCRVALPGETLFSYRIRYGQIGMATLCSVTLNGIMLRHGIPMASRFGGLLEIRNGQPHRFSQIINYDGTTLDPLEIFIKGRMTSVHQAAQSGTGVIGASFREIPAASLGPAEEIIERLERQGLGGVLIIGKPSQPLLDIPVGHGRVGMVIAGGLNPVAAAEEVGFMSRNQALHTLCDFRELQPIEDALAKMA